MRALVGYAMLFIVVGIIISNFISGFFEIFLGVLLLLGAYVLLCRGC
ncbi:MAG: hypothetical protein PUG10_10460 [Lachnospiraceae bacterium]|nr:hypothetical protein [Lachnospiraceae bacterium]